MSHISKATTLSFHLSVNSSQKTLYYSEKQLKDIKILLTFNITFKKIIFNQSILISYRTTTMQFSKMQNEIYGSLVTIQYN